MRHPNIGMIRDVAMNGIGAFLKEDLDHTKPKKFFQRGDFTSVIFETTDGRRFTLILEEMKGAPKK